MSADGTCPGCDGTITRAIQQGREVTTYERCEACSEREGRVLERFSDALIARPCVIRHNREDFRRAIQEGGQP